MRLSAKEFGKAFVFKKIRPDLKRFFMRAGYDDVPYELFGFLFYITLGLTYLIYILFIYPRLQDYGTFTIVATTFLSWVIVPLTIMSLIIVYMYFDLTIKIYKRTKEIETILPEYLQVVSSNLKGGLSFEKSLWNAINPEFSIVAKEITIVSKKVMTGNDLTDALEDFTQKYDSPLLKRSIDLIIGEVESGGQIAFIVDKVIDNIRKSRVLKEEMAASTLTYMIFIGAIVILIAPGLFALSFHLLSIMSGFGAQVSTNAVSGFPISLGAGSLNIEDYRIFSVLCLLLIALFSAILISIIQTGDMRGGFKYIPAFMLSSVFFYFLFTIALGFVFGGIV
ncbi:MAG: type II secretion system F family protein [Candidatus Woesearchaeota archaeon]